MTGKCVGTAEKWGKVADHIWYGKNGTEGQKEEKQLETEKSAEKRKGSHHRSGGLSDPIKTSLCKPERRGRTG